MSCSLSCSRKIAIRLAEIGVHAAGVGFIWTSTPRTSKPKLSDWLLWERDDIPGGIVLEATSLCLKDPGGALFCVVQKADVTGT